MPDKAAPFCLEHPRICFSFCESPTDLARVDTGTLRRSSKLLSPLPPGPPRRTVWLTRSCFHPSPLYHHQLPPATTSYQLPPPFPLAHRLAHPLVLPRGRPRSLADFPPRVGCTDAIKAMQQAGMRVIPYINGAATSTSFLNHFPRISHPHSIPRGPCDIPC